MTMKSTFIILALLYCSVIEGQILKKTENAIIEIVSEAPLELIKAASSECSGVLDIVKHEFAFRVRIRSFEGFNSPLQKEHFNENYMESDLYPTAFFTGRILDEVDLNSPGKYELTLKGRLNIHDVVEERVIFISMIIVEDGRVEFKTSFEVALDAHNIKVPRIVYQKISETITVSVKGTMK